MNTKDGVAVQIMDEDKSDFLKTSERGKSSAHVSVERKNKDHKSVEREKKDLMVGAS